MPAVPYNFVNGTIADANQVNADFAYLASSVVIGYPTKAAAIASTHHGSVAVGETIQVAGGQYQRIAAGPADIITFQASDATWWRLLDTVINPKMVGATGDGAADDTTIIQTLADYCAANYGTRAIDMTGIWGVTTLVFTKVRLCGAGTLIALASVSTPCLIQWAGDCVASGSLLLIGNYQATPYVCGCQIANGASASQFNFLMNVQINGFLLAWQIGVLAHPSALVSENTIVGGGVYGCPQVALVIGIETFISVIGAQWVGSDFGGNGAWQALPKNGITAIGGNVFMTGGELQVGQTLTTLPAILLQPLTGGDGVIYGRVTLVNTSGDTGGQFCVTSNPSVLAISGIRIGGIVVIGMNGSAVGANYDAGPWIETDASFVGDVIVQGCSWGSVAIRSSANVLAHGTGARISLDQAGFGPNFLPGGFTVPAIVAPDSPNAKSFTIYMDTSDDLLKAKNSAGTVKVLAP